MITDDFLLLSNAQASVRAAGNYLSTNTIDLGQNRDIGSGEQLFVYVNVDVAFAGGTSVEFQVVVADDAALSSNLQVLASSGAIAEASLVVGYAVRIPIPAQLGSRGKRYLGVRAVGVGTHTLGSFSARVVTHTGDVKYYPLGYTPAY